MASGITQDPSRTTYVDGLEWWAEKLEKSASASPQYVSGNFQYSAAQVIVDAYDRGYLVHDEPTQSRITRLISLSRPGARTDEVAYNVFRNLQAFLLNPAKRPMQVNYELDALTLRKVAELIRRGSERTTDKKTDIEKKVPPPDVSECARFIVAQTKLIAEGKLPAKSKKQLIADHLGTNDTGAMERQLRPDRFGWLLELSGQADK